MGFRCSHVPKIDSFLYNASQWMHSLLKRRTTEKTVQIRYMNLVSVSPFSLSDSTSPCLDFHYLYSRSSGYYLTGMRECTGWSGNPLLASDFHLSYSIYCNLECQMAEQKRADTLVVQLEKKTFITHAGN